VSESWHDETITEDEITCPYCGHKDVDSSEYPDSAEIDCSECGKEFTAYRNTHVYYTMFKKKENELPR
jgi:DNA-directed RNA polymerase subunit RPC12/RpoP